MTEVLAINVEDVAKLGGPGRTKTFEAIRRGQLTARKCGSRTIILMDDLKKFLEDLPVAGVAE